MASQVNIAKSNLADLETVCISKIDGLNETLLQFRDDLNQVSAQSVESFGYVYEDLKELETFIQSVFDRMNNLDTNVELEFQEINTLLSERFTEIFTIFEVLKRDYVTLSKQLKETRGGETIAEILDLHPKYLTLCTRIQVGTLCTVTRKKFNFIHKWLLRVLLGAEIEEVWM